MYDENKNKVLKLESEHQSLTLELPWDSDMEDWCKAVMTMCVWSGISMDSVFNGMLRYVSDYQDDTFTWHKCASRYPYPFNGVNPEVLIQLPDGTIETDIYDHSKEDWTRHTGMKEKIEYWSEIPYKYEGEY